MSGALPYDCVAFDCGCSPEAMRSCLGRADDDELTIVPLVSVEESDEEAW